MPRKQTARNANGAGTIRKITTTKNGKTYTYWQARYTSGYAPGTGKQIQRSITGKTKSEVAQKLRSITTDLDCGTYIAPNKQTLGEWLDIWVNSYLLNVKPRTLHIYQSDIRLHIKPYLGAVRLESLTAPTIQAFYQKLMSPSKAHPNGLSAKTIKNVHGVLHKALKQAVLVGYLHFNPADACVLPRVEKATITPLDDDQISDFLTAIRGNRFELLFIVSLFTGMREGEVMGLTWDCVDFERGVITVDKQLQLHQEKGCKAYELIPTKSDKARSIAAAPSVMAQLKRQHAVQSQQRLMAGSSWQNKQNLVFTDALGGHLTKPTVYREFKRIVASIGRPDARFHDLRHSFAVASIRAGDDIKTVQGNLGHATAAFTLDVYGHVTMQMKKESAARMEAYIKSVSSL